MQIQSRGIRPPDKTVTVLYEGQPISVRPGVSVAAALSAVGVNAYRHAAAGDRGLFCGMGVCGECAISIDDGPSQLACLTPVRDGMRLSRQPLKPAISTDANQSIAGSDQVIEPDMLVVGGGPAGLAAAAQAAEAGIKVLLVDERPSLGGQYYKQPSASFELDPRHLDQQYAAGRSLIERTRAAGVEILAPARIWGAAGPEEFYAAQDDDRWVIRPKRVVLATGAYERAVPLPGWTLPGVMTTGAAQSLLRAYQVAPGRRVLIAGNGPLNAQLAAELVRAGGEVVALVELAAMTHPRHAIDAARLVLAGPGLARDGVGYLATLRRSKVPILTGQALVRVEGEQSAERAVIARIDADGRPVPATERHFDVDAVCIGLGFMPGNELARTLGVRHRIDAHTGGYVVECSDTGRTSVQNIWVVGDTAQVRGAKVAQSVGTLAGADVAVSLGREHPEDDVRRAQRQRVRHERFQSALWRIYQAPALYSQLADEETLVCRCESVSLGTLDHELDGVHSAGALKRTTRAGMGWCQGRFCGFVVANRVASTTGMGVDAYSGFAPQPPFRPMPLSALAADSDSEEGEELNQ